MIERGMLIVLCLASAFSVPWPNSIDLIQIILGAILVVAFFRPFVASIVIGELVVLVYFLLFYMQFLRGYGRYTDSSIAIDILSYLFWGMPIFYYCYLRLFNLAEAFKEHKIIIHTFILLGVFLSIRAMLPHYIINGFDLHALYESQLIPHVEYLFLDPSVLFSAVVLMGFAFENLRKKNIVRSCICFVVSIIAIAAPFIAVMRAPFLVYILSFVLFATIFYKAHILKILGVMLLFFVVALLFADVTQFVSALINKTEEHGLNGKSEDFSIIIDTIFSEGYLGMLWGLGFGSEYFSNVLGEKSRYTHNLFSAALLKGGLTLTMCVIAAFVYIFIRTSKAIIHYIRIEDSYKITLYWSFLSSFVLASVVQPGYRTINYGVLIVIFILLEHDFYSKKIERWV